MLRTRIYRGKYIFSHSANKEYNAFATISTHTSLSNLLYANLTHFQTTNYRLFQTKEFADDNFKFDENGRKLSKWIENTVGKGEIARYEQFLLFPQCFQKACFPGASKSVIVWEWVLMYRPFSKIPPIIPVHAMHGYGTGCLKAAVCACRFSC